MSKLPELVMPEHAVDLAAAANAKTIDFIQIALQNWKLIAFGAFLGTLMGIAAYLFSGPDYKATVTVMVKRSEQSVTNGERRIKAFSGRAEHIPIIKSPLIMKPAVEDGKLTELASFRGNKTLVGDLSDDIVVIRTAGGEISTVNVFDITYTNKNADDAVKVVEAVAKSYGEWLKKDHSKHTDQIMAAVLRNKKQLEIDLQQKKVNFEKFVGNADQMVWTQTAAGKTSQTNIHNETIKDISKRLLAVQDELRLIKISEDRVNLAIQSGKSEQEVEQIVQEYVIRERSLNKGGSGKEGGGNGQEKLLELLLKQTELVGNYGENHPNLVEIRRQIKEARALMAQNKQQLPVQSEDGTTAQIGINHADNYLKSLKKRTGLLKDQEKVYDSILREQVKLANGLTGYSIDLQVKRDEFDNTKDILAKIDNRLDEIGMNQASAYTMEFLHYGRKQLNIKKPIKFIGAAMMLMAGAVMGLACLREIKDMTIRSADDLRIRLGLPVIGGVPFYPAATREELQSSQFPRLNPGLCYAHKPGSLEAESIRSVRTAVLVQAEASKAKVIQVTSAEPGDGKSTLTANLAIALAQSGKRVLLIEADMRRSVQAGLFGITPQVGLTDVLRGDVHFNNVVQQTVFEGLSIVLAGDKPAAPAELLASNALRLAIDDSRNDYDLILIDSPPLLAVADPCIIGRQTDGVIMVVRLGKNQYAYISRAQELLATHNIKLMGVIANGIFDLTEGDGYGYGYGYGNEPGQEQPTSLPGKIGKILEPYVSA